MSFVDMQEAVDPSTRSTRGVGEGPITGFICVQGVRLMLVPVTRKPRLNLSPLLSVMILQETES